MVCDCGCICAALTHVRVCEWRMTNVNVVLYIAIWSESIFYEVGGNLKMKVTHLHDYSEVTSEPVITRYPLIAGEVSQSL
jgi:hypothetical protein